MQLLFFRYAGGVLVTNRSSSSKDVLKIFRKFKGEQSCRNVILIKLFCIFIEIAFWHECFPVNFLRIFRTPFPKNTSGAAFKPISLLLLIICFGYGASYKPQVGCLIIFLISSDLLNYLRSVGTIVITTKSD